MPESSGGHEGDGFGDPNPPAGPRLSVLDADQNLPRSPRDPGRRGLCSIYALPSGHQFPIMVWVLASSILLPAWSLLVRASLIWSGWFGLADLAPSMTDQPCLVLPCLMLIGFLEGSELERSAVAIWPDFWRLGIINQRSGGQLNKP